MATANIISDLTIISNCDATTGWSEGALEPDIKIQGTNALVTAIRNDGTVTFTPAASLDMSATDTHLRLWLFHSFYNNLAVKANGGIRLFVSDGTNTNEYFVGGRDTHEGAWELFQANLAVPDVDGGANLASITSCGYSLLHDTAARNIDNTWWDFFTFGTGYSIWGGTSGDRVTWSDVATADLSAGWGVLQLDKGVYFANAAINLGDTTGSSDLYFDGDNEVVVFYDADESNTLYKIKASGSATGVTDIMIDNTVIKASGQATRFDFFASGSNLDRLEMNGTQINRAEQVQFKSGSTITNCVFDGCEMISPFSSSFNNNTISNFTGSDPAALYLEIDDFISDLSFISNANGGHALYIDTPGTYILTNFTYQGYASIDGTTGNEVLYNNSGGAVTASIVGGETPTVRNGAGASTLVSQDSTVTFTGLKDNTEVRIYATGTGTELAGVENATDGSTDNRSFSATISAGTVVDYVIISLLYENIRIEGFTWPTVTQDLPVVQRFDRNYENPPGP